MDWIWCNHVHIYGLRVRTAQLFFMVWLLLISIKKSWDVIMATICIYVPFSSFLRVDSCRLWLLHNAHYSTARCVLTGWQMSGENADLMCFLSHYCWVSRMGSSWSFVKNPKPFYKHPDNKELLIRVRESLRSNISNIYHSYWINIRIKLNTEVPGRIFSR